MKKTEYLIRNFIVYSFIACFITAVLLIIFIRPHVKEDRISSDQQMIHLTLHYIVEPELVTDDFKSPLSQLKVNILDQRLQKLIGEGTISSVKIWNKQNKLIYSSNNNDKNIYIDSRDLKNSIQNNLSYIVTKDTSNNSNLDSEEVIKFYLPIIYNNEN
jgi:hypothetical protein